jgi:hypothetical protein
MFPDQPNLKSDLQAAARLLRLLTALTEVDVVETTVGATRLNDGQRPSSMPRQDELLKALRGLL